MSWRTGVLPSNTSGNAAWLRLAVISYNVLTALKRLALPADYCGPARAAAISDLLHGRSAGDHARQMRLRLAREAEGIVLWLEACDSYRFRPNANRGA